MKIIHDNIRWLVAALLIFALPAVAEVRDTLEFDISGSSSESITVDGETFKLYTLPDCDLLNQTGAPMLPVKYIRLSVPYNATDITVTGAGPYTQSVTGDRIYPAPVPIPTDGSVTEAPDMVLDSAIYMTDAYWPASAAELVGDGFYMGENYIVTVAVYPMVYNPVTSQMRSHSQVRLTVSYTQGDTPGNMLVRYDPQLRQEERRQAMALVANPGQIEAHAVPASAVQHMIQQNPDTSSWPVPGYEYMVITTRELAPAFKRLIALKQQKGYRAGVVCVEDIVNDPLVQNGDSCILADGTSGFINDDAGKIRQYLKLNWSYGTKFVFFGGKSTIGLPFRYTDGKYMNYNRIFVPSDTYFSNMSTMWKMRNDTVCELQPLSDPFFPDLFIGRILPTNESETANYITKVLRYELNPGNGNTSYLQSALFTQCDWLQKKSYAQLAAEQLYPLFPDTVIVEEWNKHYPMGGDVIRLINSHQFGYINFHGHGSSVGLMVNAYPIDHNMHIWGNELQPFGIYAIPQYHGYDPNDTENSLTAIENKLFPFVFYSMACTAMPFDKPDLNCTSYNVGESLTLLKDKGGIAFLGNTRNGHPFSFKIEQEFQKKINDGIFKLGIADALSKTIPIPNDGHQDSQSGLHDKLTHNLMGDPEQDIWTDEPSKYQNISINRTNSSIIIDGLQTAKTFVGVNNGLIQMMDSASSSRITIANVNPNSTVMVYSHNNLPYIAPLYLQNERVERSQYVIANDVYAGRNVDTNRTAGDLTVAEGSEYEIETKGQVVLAPGFKVEKGALFSVIQSDY